MYLWKLIHLFQETLTNRKFKRTKYFFCYSVKVFTVTFDELDASFNASLLNCIYFFLAIRLKNFSYMGCLTRMD